MTEGQPIFSRCSLGKRRWFWVVYPTFRTIGSAFSSDFKLGAKWSRQPVGSTFNPEESKNLLGGLGNFVVERA